MERCDRSAACGDCGVVGLQVKVCNGAYVVSHRLLQYAFWPHLSHGYSGVVSSCLLQLLQIVGLRGGDGLGANSGCLSLERSSCGDVSFLCSLTGGRTLRISLGFLPGLPVTPLSILGRFVDVGLVPPYCALSRSVALG